MVNTIQESLFTPLSIRPHTDKALSETTGTFSDNMKLPVHRWFRYSAGFSALWVKKTILAHNAKTVLDPFVGSGTICIAADEERVKSYGIESHPFVFRLAKGKLAWTASIDDFKEAVVEITKKAECNHPSETLESSKSTLLEKCYSKEALVNLFKIKEAFLQSSNLLNEKLRDLLFLAITAILRRTSYVGTAQWQYILPNKRKAIVLSPFEALAAQASMMVKDIILPKI